MASLEKFTRPLNEKERRLLQSTVAWRKRRVRAGPKRITFFALTMFTLFWGVLLLASLKDKRGPAWYQTGLIAAAFVFPLSAWTYLRNRPELIADLQRHEGALRRNEAQVTRVQSNEMVEFEEQEDEGACYAFQLDNRRILFISGQEFYPSAKFPNTDFSLVDIPAEDGVLVQSFVEKNGRKLRALREIPSQQKAHLRIPVHLEIVDGDLDRIEQILAPSG